MRIIASSFLSFPVVMIIDPAKKRCRHVLAGISSEKKGSSRMLVNKRRYVVYESRNEDDRT
jgi:hypothetical protein